jgi:hypothetical protein
MNKVEDPTPPISGAEDEHQPRTMNAGAHRRPPPQIGAPALIWQRAYWIPREEKIWVSDDEAHQSAWRKCIDNTLAHILHRLQGPDPVARFTSPNYDPDTLYLFDHKIEGFLEARTLHLTPLLSSERSVRHDVFTMQMNIGNDSLTVSARRHYEYFTLLFSVDFSGRQFDPAPGRSVLNRVWNAFLELHQLIGTRYSAVEACSDNGSEDACFEADLRAAEDCTKLMFTDLTTFMNRLTKRSLKSSINRQPCGIDGCGEKFAEFFGIAYSISKTGEDISFPARDVRGRRLKRSAEVGGFEFTDAEAPPVLSAAWPVIVAADVNQKSDPIYGEPERVVAAFNHRQSLYASSLGRRIPAAAQLDIDPLVYSLLVSYRSPWRLGRLIDKINALGVLRLAALRDLKAMSEISNQINALSVKLRDYDRAQRDRDQASVDRARQTRPPLELDPAGEAPGAAGLTDIRTIDKHFRWLDDEQGPGIKYRIERSRYYFKSYETILESLHPHRVVGFQFYSDFIKSRVYDAFDFIDRLGKRYDNLRQEIKLRISGDSLEEARGLQRSIERQTRAATDLLSTAEILSIVPLTYYGGHVLETWVGEACHLPAIPGAGLGQGFAVHALAEQTCGLSDGALLSVSTIAALSLSILLSIWLHRRRKSREPSKSLARRPAA